MNEKESELEMHLRMALELIRTKEKELIAVDECNKLRQLLTLHEEFSMRLLEAIESAHVLKPRDMFLQVAKGLNASVEIVPPVVGMPRLLRINPLFG